MLFVLGGVAPSQWEDITGSSPLTLSNDCVTFTTTVSARLALTSLTNFYHSFEVFTPLITDKFTGSTFIFAGFG